MYTSIILCGGKNSRLKNSSKKIIKPLIVYKKKTLLEHHLKTLNKIKIRNIFINTYKNKNFFYTIKKKKEFEF